MADLKIEIEESGFEIFPAFETLDDEMKVVVAAGVQGQKGDSGETGATGPQGIQGEQGPQGEKGDAAFSLQIGTTGTGEPGTAAAVENVGTAQDVVLNFTIPKGDGPPTGAVMQFSGSNAPAGWLLCKGQTVSRTTYADLFEVIGTTYGSGDGVTTFNVPDMSGRAPVGVSDSDADFDLGDTGGEKTHTLSVAEMPAHTHTQWRRDYAVGGGSVAGANQSKVTEATGSTGGGQAHNNMPPYLAMNFIIKY